MTYTEMQTKCALLLGDPNNKKFSAAEITAAINESLPIIARDLEVSLTTYWDYTTITDAASGSSNQRYTLQADFMKTIKVEIIANTTEKWSLYRLSLHDFTKQEAAQAGQTGRPLYYKEERGATGVTDPQRPGDLWLYPIPDTNGGSNYTLRHHYYQLPTALSTGPEVSELPLYTHLAVCYFAVKDVCMKRNEVARSRHFKNEYNEEVVKAKSFLHRRQADSPNIINDDAGYTNTEW